MKTEFTYYDENKELKNGNIIISFGFNDKKYVVYEAEEDQNSDLEVLQIKELDESNIYPNLYPVDDETLAQIKDILLTIYNS